MRRVLIAASIVAICMTMLFYMVSELPAYGSASAPAMNEVVDRYLSHGLHESGATNIVSDIIVDYRAYDTLMETTVLFTAVLAVMITLKRK
jgi:multisubunit Na+/H+ antiporter MnhB subunit